MKALEKTVAASLEEEVALLGDKHPIVGLISTVDVIQKVVSEGQEVITSPLEDNGEGFTSRGRGESTDRMRDLNSFGVRGPGVTAASWGGRRVDSGPDSLSEVSNFNRRLGAGSWKRGFPDSDPDKRRRGCRLWGSGPEGEDIDKMVLGGEMGTSSAAGEVTDAATLDGVCFAKLSIRSAIDGFGTLLSDLKLLELRGEDVGRADGLIVFNEHNPMMDGSLK